jgi:hypothetical protein
MEFRAVKIILATFLVIAFATPFFRLSVAMPKQSKESGTFALAENRAMADSVSVRVTLLRAE